MTKTEWFAAAIAEDTKALESLFRKFMNQVDNRKTEAEQKVVRGFGAIHYACLYNATLSLQFLLPHELSLRTERSTVFRTPNQQAGDYALAAGSDCLHIALAKGRWNVAYDILDYVRNAGTDISTQIDAQGFTHFALLFKFPPAPDVLKLLKNDVLVRELTYHSGKGHANLIFVACQNAAIKHLEQVMSLVQYNRSRQEQLFQMLTDVDAQGKTVFDYLASTNSDALSKCRNLIYSLVPAAIRYLEQLSVYQRHIEKFKKRYKKSDQQHVQEYRFQSGIQGESGLIVNEQLFMPEGMRGVRLII